MTEVGNLETIYSALKAVSLVRSACIDAFNHLQSSPQTLYESEPEDLSQNTYVTEFQSLCEVIATRIRELETASTLIYPLINTSSTNFGNVQLIGQDPNYEKTSLYSDMVISYRWIDNVQEYSTLAFQALQSKFTKRNSRYRQRPNNRLPQNNHNISTINLDLFINQLQRSFESISIEVVRPFGVFIVLKVALDRTLRAAIVLRGFVIERVIIKGFDEDFENLNSTWSKNEKKQYYMNDATHNETFDLWTQSRHKVFRTITDHANAAILHFYAPFQMENAIKAYMIWFRSYSNLFTASCRKCENRLLNSMPPTWRDLRTNDAYHFECRP